MAVSLWDYGPHHVGLCASSWGAIRPLMTGCVSPHVLMGGCMLPLVLMGGCVSLMGGCVSLMSGCASLMLSPTRSCFGFALSL